MAAARRGPAGVGSRLASVLPSVRCHREHMFDSGQDAACRRRTSTVMADKSAIEWTEATWNPVTGCDKVSPGCAHCYAETFAERWRGIPGHPYEQGFALKLWPQRLEQPLKWSRPRMIFVNSMSDLFHERIPDAYIEQVFEVMGQAHWHTFQILTKRHERLADLAEHGLRIGHRHAANQMHVVRHGASPGFGWIGRRPGGGCQVCRRGALALSGTIIGAVAQTDPPLSAPAVCRTSRQSGPWPYSPEIFK